MAFIPQSHGQPVQRRPRKQRLKIQPIWFAHLALIAGGIIWMYPFLWMLGSSFKTNKDFFDRGLNIFPGQIAWSNYIDAWNKASFGTYFLNTVITAAFSVLFVLLFTSMAGYALARTKFPGKGLILGLIGLTLFLPHGYTILPTFDIIQKLGLLNSLASIITVQTAGGMVFGTFLFMGYFTTIDRELEDAARVDGASYHQIFWQVMLPLARPMIATVALFNFIGAWNSFFFPLVFTLGVPELRTLAVGMYAFIGQNSVDWTLLVAGAVITLAPIMIVFLFLQRYFINGIAGAVKS
ncbi:carbohydrate ABC transporter permease [Tengunoibacter tsumagoiensis]|uniref:Sugar ABC transporter permease n=1 Tax=Tengunoibacter tsumagoiensis TaxID=2014871 RepID=A0A401ZV46_9CHLR|nr:carbohydrate ABC transporter permease [Tengunoibacter tsumagoiensis]GCE10771.1 sugar ABC transporter permease [Tengunoibacter tsumagoiensis]